MAPTNLASGPVSTDHDSSAPKHEGKLEPKFPSQRTRTRQRLGRRGLTRQMRRPVYKAPSQRDAATGKDSDMPRFLPSGPNAGNSDQDRVVTVSFKGAI